MWNALRQEHLIQSAQRTVLLEYCRSPVRMNDVFLRRKSNRTTVIFSFDIPRVEVDAEPPQINQRAARASSWLQPTHTRGQTGVDRSTWIYDARWRVQRRGGPKDAGTSECFNEARVRWRPVRRRAEWRPPGYLGFKLFLALEVFYKWTFCFVCTMNGNWASAFRILCLLK